MKLTGKIDKIFETQQVSGSFKKREFVVEYAENPQYPEYIKMEFIQDKCDILDKYQVGMVVEVELNLKGRKWTNQQGQDQWFNTLQAWKMKSEQSQPAQQQSYSPPPQQPPPQGGNQQNNGIPSAGQLDDDIPY